MPGNLGDRSMCEVFPCEQLTSIIYGNPNIVELLNAFAKQYHQQKERADSFELSRITIEIYEPRSNISLAYGNTIRNKSDIIKFKIFCPQIKKLHTI